MDSKIEYIYRSFKESIDCKRRILENDDLVGDIKILADRMTQVLKDGGRVYLAGNGGSAADSQHIAGELVSRFNFDRPGLPGVALTTDTSILTAVSNDYGYQYVFSRQIEALAKRGDMFIGISTSGNSENILYALRKSKELGLYTVGFVGESGGKMVGECDSLIRVPSTNTPTIQESHILIGHVVCGLVENAMFGT